VRPTDRQFIHVFFFPGIVGFADETSMVNALLGQLETAKTDAGSSSVDNALAGVVFINPSTDLTSIEYHLRFPNTLRTVYSKPGPFATPSNWQTDSTYPVFQTLGPRSNNSRTGGPPRMSKSNSPYGKFVFCC